MHFCDLLTLCPGIQGTVTHRGSDNSQRRVQSQSVFNLQQSCQAPISTSLTLYLSPGPESIALLSLKQSIKHVLICHIQFNMRIVFRGFFHCFYDEIYEIYEIYEISPVCMVLREKKILMYHGNIILIILTILYIITLILELAFQLLM